MPKAPTTTDADGLRLFCQDGHRLYWTEKIRADMRRPVTGLAAWSHPYVHEHGPAVCSNGDYWKQRGTPIKNQAAIERAQRYPRKNETVPEVVWGTPVIVPAAIYDGYTSGETRFIIKLTHLSRTVESTIRCTNYLEGSFYDRHYDDDAPPLPPELHHVAVTDKPETEEAFLAVLDRLRTEGWIIESYKVHCPACTLHLAAREARRTAERAAAQALEGTPLVTATG